MFNPVIENPQPDFDELIRILKGEQEPNRVPLVELRHHEDIIKLIVEDYMGETWAEVWDDPEHYYQMRVKMYHHLGYDYVASAKGRWSNLPEPKRRVGSDTSSISRTQQREWAEEGVGIIENREDFEKIPWDKVEAETAHYEHMAKYLPDGMKIIARTRYFADIFEKLLGIEGMAYMMFDDMELVETVFEVWGQKVLAHFEEIMAIDAIGAVFHGMTWGTRPVR